MHECTYLVNQQTKEDRRTSEKHSRKLNVIICEQHTKEDLAKFLHAACFSPVKSTCFQAINNNYSTTWNGIDYKFISKHLHPSMATAKEHMN